VLNLKGESYRLRSKARGTSTPQGKTARQVGPP
jgi:hypothetical protein